MTATLLDGRAIAEEIRAALKVRANRLIEHGVRPALAAVMVGENPASQVYVRSKAQACESIGIRSTLERFPADVGEETLLAHIAGLNADSAVHAVLIQLPLPRHIDMRDMLEAVAPEKDVDGFRFQHLGALLIGAETYPPCTPSAVVRMLEHESIPIARRHAVVVGRSPIVGKPLALMLLARDATVTVCHSRTPDLAGFTRQADILVVAAGRPGLVTADMVKPGAVVVDVGVNRPAGGRIVGDVDFDGVRRVASRITPVPGGVGPMTITMLLENTLRAAERAAAAPRG
ncbi:MAG: bifunctional methylenetetrahydrofolate dehydrogenase/methenyltetrahydrofolate cyclohydrolase FolD [Pseudomonadota bacterium]